MNDTAVELTHARPPADAADGDAVLQANGIAKRYVQGDLSVRVLDELSLSITRGERVAIVGASGSGKSTLMHLLAGLDSPDSGRVNLCGQDVYALGPAARGRLRNRHVGFVYQMHHLLPEFSALENVALPRMIGGAKRRESQAEATRLLQRVGLGQRLRHKPAELSGGERQRAAIARALVTRPDLVLADEPTGNLDEATALQVYDLMLELNRECGTSFLLVTHDRRLAARMDRQLILSNGLLQPVAA